MSKNNDELRNKLNTTGAPDGGNMTEDALRDAGKDENEIRSTGQMDRADEELEETLPPKARIANSPVHKVVWDSVPVEAFLAEAPPENPGADVTIGRVLELVDQHLAANTLYDERGKIREAFLTDVLGEAGYWGLRIGTEHGGSGSDD